MCGLLTASGTVSSNSGFKLKVKTLCGLLTASGTVPSNSGFKLKCEHLVRTVDRLVITLQMLIYLDGSRLTASLTVMVRFWDISKLITII